MSSNNKIRVAVIGIKVIKGQGIGEGNLELSIKAIEGKNFYNWGPATVDNGGTYKSIDKGVVATYTVPTGTLTKRIELSVYEKDNGFNADDSGQGSITFDLTGNMQPTPRSVRISLDRENSKAKGVVEVFMLASVA